MLHQRRIKPFRGGWMLTAAVLWPSRDLRPVPHMRLPNLPVYAAVSAARAVYHPLLSAMGRCRWLSRAHRGGELFPHSKGPFCCHARWDYRGKRSHWAFPSETSHRARRSGALSASLSVWLVEVRLSGSDQCSRSCGGTERKSWGADFWGSLVEMCVRLLLDRGRLQSPPPSGLPNTILHLLPKHEPWTPSRPQHWIISL